MASWRDDVYSAIDISITGVLTEHPVGGMRAIIGEAEVVETCAESLACQGASAHQKADAGKTYQYGSPPRPQPLQEGCLGGLVQKMDIAKRAMEAPATLPYMGSSIRFRLRPPRKDRTECVRVIIC